MRLPSFTKTRSSTAVIAALVVIVAGFAVWHFSGGQPHAAAPAAASPVPVSVGSVRKTEFPVYLGGLGTVTPFNTVSVKTQVDGQIERIAFKEGQFIHQGDLLVKIDPRPLQAALEGANARLAQDNANLQNAQHDLERYTTLAKESFGTLQQRDEQAATVAQLKATVQSDQAAITAAQTQLGYATINSPITGVAGFLQITEGNIVHAADQNPIVTVTQLQPISVVFTAPEEEIPEIQKGLRSGPLKVSAISSLNGEALADGTLAVINNQVDIATGTIQLKASFENKDNALWPGLAVVTRLQVQTLQGVTVAPEDAIQRGPNGFFAYVIDQGKKARIRNLTVGRIAEGLAVIDKGLGPGDLVVTAGQSRLKDGTEVAINAARPQPPGSNPPIAARQGQVAANRPAGAGGTSPPATAEE